MNGYYNYNRRSQYKGAKKRLTLNILIIIAIVLAIVAFSLALGNHLKNKLDSADIDRETEGAASESETSKPDDEVPERNLFLKNNRSADELKEVGGYLDLSDFTETSQIEKYVEYLKGTGYSAVVFEVSDENGKLTYSSNAVSALTGADVKGSMTNFEFLSTAIAKAKSLGMRTTVILSLDCLFSKEESARVKEEIAKAVSNELGSMGLDEFIFTNATSADNFTSTSADILYTFINEVKKALPDIDIGIVLDRKILENPEKTPIVELVFGFADFFAIDFSDEKITEDEINEFLTSHSGSITAYNVRFLSGAASCDGVARDYSVYYTSGGTGVTYVQPIEYVLATDKDGNPDFSSKMPKYTVENGAVKKDEKKEG